MPTKHPTTRPAKVVRVLPPRLTIVEDAPAPVASKPSLATLTQTAAETTARLTTLAQLVDDLGQLRDLLRKSAAAEKDMTAQLVTAMQDAGLETLPGAQAVATLGSRTNHQVDPQLLLEHCGPAAFTALRVSIEEARKLAISEAELLAIADSTSCPVLYVKERK